jgi:hypothetical protein
MKRTAIFAGVLVLLCLSLTQGALAQETATLAPSIVSAELAEGESLSEHKILTLPESVTPPRADIMFVVDLTGSMGGELAQVKSEAVDMMNQITGVIDDVRFGVISHMDYPDSYTSCGYSSTYGASTDYPYKLDQELTTYKPDVEIAVNNLALGSGYDGPESYTRVLYEAYADSNIGWRDGARKILIFWNDSIPHACDLNLCDGMEFGSTGASPGRDALVGTADDLVLNDVLNSLAADNISLIALHSGGSFYFDAWQCYSEKTGGNAFALNYDGTAPDGTDIAGYVTGLITEEIKHIDSMALQVCTEGFEGWLTSAAPAAYTDLDLGRELLLDYNIVITVPEGTEPGTYNFKVCAVGDGAEYAAQSVSIEVPDTSTVEVPVDVKPTSCPNPVNLTSKGVVPVSILGTGSLDVETIDPATVSIFGVSPVRWAIEDVASPYSPFIGKSDEMDCNTAGPDGYMDLTFKFDKQELVTAFGNVEDGQVITLQVAGQLKSEFDARAIIGEDVVRVIKKGKKAKGGK